MTHLSGNSEGVIHKSNSDVERVLWQINSICAAIITYLGNSGAKERSHVSRHFLKARTDAGLRGYYPSAETQSQAPDLLSKAA